MLKKLLYLLYQPYKWLVFLPILFVGTFIFGILAVLFSSLFNQRIGSKIGGALWSRVNGALTPVFVKVSGKENIAKGQSYIVVPNHQSLYDVFLLYGWLGIDIRWIMKKELRKIPGLGFGSAKVGHIFLDRSNQRAAAKSLEEAKLKLTNGTSVVIFPEGTRSEDGAIQNFKRGAFKLALDINLPILPVTINGTGKISPAKKGYKIFPGKASIHIHPPIDIQNYSNENIRILMDDTKKIIQSKLI